MDISASVLEISSRNVNHEPTTSLCLLNNCNKPRKIPEIFSFMYGNLGDKMGLSVSLAALCFFYRLLKEMGLELVCSLLRHCSY